MHAGTDNGWRLGLLVGCVLLVGCAAAPGGSATGSVLASPTPDSVTRNYVDLVYTYWHQYKAAEANAGGVCFGGGANGLRLVNPSACRGRAVSVSVPRKGRFDDRRAREVLERFKRYAAAPKVRSRRSDLSESTPRGDR